MCQFNNLTINEKVQLSTIGNTHCTSCSSVIRNYSGPATYQGHRNNGNMTVDSFLIVGKWQCTCGEDIKEYITPCNDYGSLLTLPAYKIDLNELTNKETSK